MSIIGRKVSFYAKAKHPEFGDYRLMPFEGVVLDRYASEMIIGMGHSVANSSHHRGIDRTGGDYYLILTEENKTFHVLCRDVTIIE